MSHEYELVLITPGGTVSPQGLYFDSYAEAKEELKLYKQIFPDDKWDIVKSGSYWLV